MEIDVETSKRLLESIKEVHDVKKINKFFEESISKIEEIYKQVQLDEQNWILETIRYEAGNKSDVVSYYDSLMSYMTAENLITGLVIISIGIALYMIYRQFEIRSIQNESKINELKEEIKKIGADCKNNKYYDIKTNDKLEDIKISNEDLLSSKFEVIQKHFTGVLKEVKEIQAKNDGDISTFIKKQEYLVEVIGSKVGILEKKVPVIDTLSKELKEIKGSVVSKAKEKEIIEKLLSSLTNEIKNVKEISVVLPKRMDDFNTKLAKCEALSAHCDKSKVSVKELEAFKATHENSLNILNDQIGTLGRLINSVINKGV